MRKELISDYLQAKRGKKTMALVLHRVSKENEALSEKLLEALMSHCSIKALAEALQVSTLEVEILARANGFGFIYTDKGTYIGRDKHGQ